MTSSTLGVTFGIFFQDIDLVDLTSSESLGSIYVHPGNAGWVALSPDGLKAYVTGGGLLLAQVDLPTRTVDWTIGLGTYNGYGVAISSDGSTAYVSSGASTFFHVIDIASHTITHSIGHGAGSGDVQLDPSGLFAYLYGGVGYLAKFDLTLFTLVGYCSTIPNGGGFDCFLAINRTGTFGYVTTGSDDHVVEVNLTTLTVSRTLATGAFTTPTGIVIDATDSNLYVISAGSWKVIDITSFTVSYTSSNISASSALALDQDGTKLYVAIDSASLDSYDPTTHASIASVPLDVHDAYFTMAVAAPTLDTVTFNSEGGSAESPVTWFDGYTVSLPTPTYSGFAFDGWFLAPTGGSPVANPYLLAGDITLYAQWTPVSEAIVMIV